MQLCSTYARLPTDGSDWVVVDYYANWSVVKVRFNEPREGGVDLANGRALCERLSFFLVEPPFTEDGFAQSLVRGGH